MLKHILYFCELQLKGYAEQNECSINFSEQEI